MTNPVDTPPAFYKDLAGCHDELWRRLVDGAENRRGGFHTPTLATVDASGRPRLRTVVLRGADPVEAILRFNCDRRSDKAAEIAASGHAALHAYDPGAKIQVRVEGSTTIHADDAIADAAWDAAQPMSRIVYGIEPGPGTPISHGDAYALPASETAIAAGRHQFCAVLVRATRLEFLYLQRSGHRRAAWRRDGDAWNGSWLAP